MSREQAIRCVEAGIEIALALAPDTDIFATGEMGIGNTTPSSAIISVLCDAPVDEVTGQGTGIDEEQRRYKVSVIKKALSINRPDPADGLDVLSKVGRLRDRRTCGAYSRRRRPAASPF